jgi:hypothetical protein
MSHDQVTGHRCERTVQLSADCWTRRVRCNILSAPTIRRVTLPLGGGIGGDHVLNVGPTNQNGEDDADLAVFVDRLAAAGSDRATDSAQAQIRRFITAGAPPPGLRRLAEALAASVAERPPSPRRPAEDPGSIVTAMRDHTLVVLEDFDAAAVARAVAALLADGRRIVVTAAAGAELAAVRAALPADTAARALDALPPLAPAELRELRRLLATSTPERRARAGQQLPPDRALPPVEEVAALCAQAVRQAGTGTGVHMVPALLANLDPVRRSAVTSVARSVSGSLGAMPHRAEYGWARKLLANLIYGQHRAGFDRMLEDTAQAVAAIDRARHVPPVSFTATPPPGGMDALRRYHDYLESGGRARSYFRSSVHREALPVLGLARVGPRVPETDDDVQRVIEHLELAERRDRIVAGCAEIGVPAPRDDGELAELADGLVKVAAAAGSVGALRHDVLFIAPNSPLSVPDVEAAEEVASAILEYADNGSAVLAGRRLDAMADDLAAAGAGTATVMEYGLSVVALRTRDITGYAAAVDALAAARREVRDENLMVALLQRLDAAAPQLARAWSVLAEDDPAALGLASFLPAEALLTAVPAPDSADVVLVLGAAGLGVERLLLTAIAPRMVAVVGPGEQSDDSPTLLSVLRRASALVIRGGGTGGGRVVPLGGGAGRTTAPVGHAGA